MEEFKILRGEIEQRSSEGRTMERNVILIASAIYAFLLTPKTGDYLAEIDKHYVQLAWYLPPIFAFLFFIRWRDSVDLIRALADYIKKYPEKQMVAGGWETYLYRERHPRDRWRSGKNPVVSRWYAVFWIVCIAGSAVVAWLRHPFFFQSEQDDAARAVVAVIIAIVGGAVVVAMLGRERMGLAVNSING